MASRRSINLVGFLGCAGVLAFDYFLQIAEGLEVCPLCVFQRVSFVAVGMVFLVAAIHDPGKAGAQAYGLAIMVTAGVGAAIAGRHIWLQGLPPDQVPACGPGLEDMLNAFPFLEMLRITWHGAGECADVSWSFLGMTIPAWALTWFAALGFVGVANNFISRAKGRQN